MAEQLRVAALCAFVNQLNELLTLAGSPPLSELRKISRCGKRDLAESTTHDILTGKRKKVPDWAWVYSFVTACRTAAEETGLDVGDLGDPKAWNERWLAARETQPNPPDASDPEERPENGDVPPPLPSNREHELRVYGRTGTRLLRECEVGDGRDCLRLAVIALLRGWPDEARQWLRRAGEAGHRDVPELVGQPGRRQAAELAYVYGCDYRWRQLSVAMFFFRLSGVNGHAEAAYQLARAHQLKGEHRAATNWFHRADANGHPQAAAELDGSWRRTTSQWDTRATPAPGWTRTLAPQEPPSPAGDTSASFV
ncbi:hypothetical protein [Nonomuraea cavernae]|uniref:hypothetical protein n=1 Tax=Nonomuraea cavernae TaxID=2045107 RepID=UPI0033ED3F13